MGENNATGSWPGHYLNFLLPEVVGNAALRADPYRPDELARCISDLARDEGLRRELRTKGSERAREFTWEQAASQTLDVYRRVVGGD